MTPTTRLRLCLAIIVGSVGYLVVVVNNSQTASAIASGYIALILTWFMLTNFWKKKL